MITHPDTVHVGIAAGATDAATLLEQHPTHPPVARLEIEWSHADDAPRIQVQLAGSTHDLDDIVTWADTLDVDTIAVTRHERPTAFTNVAVHGEYGGSIVQIWTHPRTLELVALWEQALHVPHPGVTATFSLRAMRAAALEVAEDEQ